MGSSVTRLFDYDRAVELFEVSLAAAEGLGDGEKVSRQLQNIADALLLASRQQRVFHLGIGFERLERAEAVIKRLRLEGRRILIVGLAAIACSQRSSAT